MTVIASDYPFMDIFWTMIIFFAWVAWFWVLITVLSDLFRRHDIGGWTKALWVLLFIVVPFLGVFVYLLSQGHHMAERNAKAIADQQAQMDAYVRQTAGTAGG